MKKIVIGTLIVVALFACAWLVLIPVIGGLNLNFTNPSLAGGPTDPGNGNLGQTGGNPNMVGGSVLNPCAANPGLQIQPLVENGQVVEQAFMGLDLNAEEVGNGLRYVLDVPAEAYIQYFEAWSGQTWEAVGPTNVTATAWTSWCNNSGWIGQQGFPTGQHRVIDALNMPSPLGQWISRN